MANPSQRRRRSTSGNLPPTEVEVDQTSSQSRINLTVVAIALIATATVVSVALVVSLTDHGEVATDRKVSGPSDSKLTTTPLTVAPVVVGVAPCTGTGNSPIVRPSMIYIACGTGNVSVSHISWSSWGALGAIGTGTFNVNDCLPNCAEGTFSSVPASVSLASPIEVAGTPLFQHLSVNPESGSMMTAENGNFGASP